MTRADFNDPDSPFNQKCLADVRQEYPELTAVELIAQRNEAMNKIRKHMRDNGHEVPDDNFDLMAMMKELGVTA